MHHSPRTVPESSPRSVMFVEKMDSDRTGLVPSSNWLIGLDSMDVCKDEKRVNVMFVEKMDRDRTGMVPSSNWLIGLDSMDMCKDEKRVNFTTLRDLHRDHLAHHGPSVLIQLGPTDTNNFSDLWWPRPTHDHYYPSCPSGTIRHAGPNTLVVANGFHPTTVCKIPPG